MRAVIETPLGNRITTTTSSRYVLIHDNGQWYGPNIVKRSGSVLTLEKEIQRQANKGGFGLKNEMWIYDTHTYTTCPASNQRSDSWAGNWDQCSHCGSIALTKNDGTYKAHKQPARRVR